MCIFVGYEEVFITCKDLRKSSSLDNPSGLYSHASDLDTAALAKGMGALLLLSLICYYG